MRWHNERIILLDPDILLKTHLPQEINARVDHIKEIEDCLRPITESRKPVNCWLHGRPGAVVSDIIRLIGNITGHNNLFMTKAPI